MRLPPSMRPTRLLPPVLVAVAVVLIVPVQGEQNGDRGYTVRDTATYDDMLNGGRLGVLYRDGAYVDSIDLRFGVRHVPGGLIYGAVRTYARGPECGRDRACTTFSGWIFFDGERKRDLGGMVPGLAHYSSPNVIDSVLYYWGIRPGSGEPRYEVSAMRYDFRSGRLDSLYLGSRSFQGADPAQLPRPVAEDGRVRFDEHLLTPQLRVGSGRPDRR